VVSEEDAGKKASREFAIAVAGSLGRRAENWRRRRAPWPRLGRHRKQEGNVLAKLIVKKGKRKAGTRAGVNHDKIVEAATKLWLSGGLDNFSVRAHFKGGMVDLHSAIASSALDGLAVQATASARGFPEESISGGIVGLPPSPPAGRPRGPPPEQ
jgi:hypothetical protein